MKKKIYDPVHGFIHFNDLEAALIDSEPFHRLHYIHQLGVSYLIYPGATHTRFEHSLGTMHLASLIFDRVALDVDKDYWRQMVRLAALCHDLGHLPFSHVAEKVLLGPAGHEEWTLRMIESSYLDLVWEQALTVWPNAPIQEHVAKLALGYEKLKELRPTITFNQEEYIYSQIVTGDFFGSDRIDYLLRDARATGLNYGLFDYVQLIEMLRVLPDAKGQLTLGIEEDGIESCEALLLARHFMQSRVYQHPTSKAYSFHMARFMQTVWTSLESCEDVTTYLSLTEAHVLNALETAKKDSTHPGHLDALCLSDRKKRFKAIYLSDKNILEKLLKFKEKKAIPEQMIHWDLTAKPLLKGGLNLPVLSKKAQVVPASKFSQIPIPQGKKSWLYLAPEYSFEL